MIEFKCWKINERNIVHKYDQGDTSLVFMSVVKSCCFAKATTKVGTIWISNIHGQLL